MAILKCKGSKHCWKVFFALSNPNLPLKPYWAHWYMGLMGVIGELASAVLIPILMFNSEDVTLNFKWLHARA